MVQDSLVMLVIIVYLNVQLDSVLVARGVNDEIGKKPKKGEVLYIVSDIHGRADRFHSILKQISFSRTDTLYILGDVIDRNPDGIQILQEIMASENMLMILGNHEHMMLNVLQDSTKKTDAEQIYNLALWYYNGGEISLQAFKSLSKEEQEKIVAYLQSLPLEREVVVDKKTYLLIHGSPGSTYNNNLVYSDRTAYAVWNRLDPFAENKFTGITVICGHTPTVFFTRKTPMEVFINGNIICMDCGCAFPDGRLGCLCLETNEILYSADAKMKDNKWWKSKRGSKLRLP